MEVSKPTPDAVVVTLRPCMPRGYDVGAGARGEGERNVTDVSHLAKLKNVAGRIKERATSKNEDGSVEFCHSTVFNAAQPRTLHPTAFSSHTHMNQCFTHCRVKNVGPAAQSETALLLAASKLQDVMLPHDAWF